MTARRKTTPLKAATLRLVPPPNPAIVRLGRVAEARERIAAGWYDRAEVRDSLVEAVLLEMRGR